MPSETPELRFPSLLGPPALLFLPLALSFPSTYHPPLPLPVLLPPSHLSSVFSLLASLSSFPLVYLPFSSLSPPSSFLCPSFSFFFFYPLTASSLSSSSTPLLPHFSPLK